MLAQLDASVHTCKDREGKTVAQRFAQEKPKLQALPLRPFEARLAEPVLVNRLALVRIEGADYSLPEHWHGLMAMAHVGVADIVFECRGETERVPKIARGGRLVQYRHYRRELGRRRQSARSPRCWWRRWDSPTNSCGNGCWRTTGSGKRREFSRG